VTIFVVERFLPGWSRERIDDLLATLAGDREPQRDFGVNYLRSILIPDDETCLCLFEAVDVAGLVAYNERIGPPVDRIVVGEVHAAGSSTAEWQRDTARTRVVFPDAPVLPPGSRWSP